MQIALPENANVLRERETFENIYFSSHPKFVILTTNFSHHSYYALLQSLFCFGGVQVHALMLDGSKISLFFTLCTLL